MRAARTALAAASVWLLAELARGGMPWVPAFLVSIGGLWALREEHGGGEWVDSPAFVFLACLAVYLSTFRWHGGDDAPNSLLPFCLLRHGTLALDPVIDPWFTGKTADFTVRWGGHWLSVYPVAPAILALPLYVVPALAGVVPGEVFLHHLSKIAGAAITAASVAVLHRAVRRRCSAEWALGLAALYGLGSWSLSVSSQALWQHGPAQLGVALGLLGLVEEGTAWAALSGFGFALAVAARPDSVFYAAAGGIFALLPSPRRLPGFAAGACAPTLLLAWYWLHYTGRLLPPEAEFQKALFTGFQPAAFAALLLSPGRGLLLYFPTAVFGVWAAVRSGKDDLAAWLLPACAATWVFMAFYVNWTGGGTFGPRYFATASLVLTYACAGVERDIRSSGALRAAWGAALAYSVWVHATGAFFNWPESGPRADALFWGWRAHPVGNLCTAAGALARLAPGLRLLVVAVLAASSAALALRLARRLQV